MTKKEIIANIEAMNYYYNQENEESYSFWKEAVKKVPDFVKQDIEGLRAEMKSFWNEDFSFSKEMAKIFAPLNLNLTVDKN